MEKIGSLRLEVRRQEIGRYLEKIGSLRLGDKKWKDTWRK